MADAESPTQDQDPNATIVRLKTPSSCPLQIGNYHLRRMIASGGMGTVYEALQENPRRTVAVKVMKPGIASRSTLRRFEYESQILARLRHNNIAQVYDAGVYDDGSGAVPYFVMEYIPGAKPMTEFARVKGLGTREKLVMFSEVCDAVHHGHQKGIIHRDLKPDNILVDSNGQPKIIDFGVARATDSDLVVTTLQTDVGQLVGTVQYMSPEQVDADPHDIDTRSDVYTLGVILYELLTGRLPYQVQNCPVYEATRLVKEQTPTKLSTIDASLRGDVETIVMKTMEKERSRRYQSADELRRDIDAYLRGDPISARPPSVLYQLQVMARRNRALFTAAAVVLVVSVAAAIISLVFAIDMNIAKNHAVDLKQQAEAAQADSTRQAAAAHLAESQARASADEARQAQERAEFQAYLGLITSADMSLRLGDVVTADQRLEAANVKLRGGEWAFLHSRLDQSVVTYPTSHEHFTSAAVSDDGRLVALASSHSQDESAVSLYASATGELVQTLQYKNMQGLCTALAFNPGATLLAAAFGEYGATEFNPAIVQVRKVLTGETALEIPGTDKPVNNIIFSADGKRLLTERFMDDRITVRDAGTGTALAEWLAHPSTVSSIAVSGNGSRLAVCGDSSGKVRVLNASDGSLIATEQCDAAVSASALNRDGTRLATGHDDGTVDIRTVGDNARLLTLRGHGNRVNAIAFSPDGGWIATASDDRTMRLWNAASGNEQATMLGHTEPVAKVAFLRDSPQILTISKTGVVKVWDIGSTGAATVFTGHRHWVEGVAFTPDGGQLVTGSQDGIVRVWNAGTGEQLQALGGHTGGVLDVAVSPKGSLIASASADRTIRLWDRATGQTMKILQGHEGHVRAVAFHPDGSQIASGGMDGTVRVFNPADGSSIAVLRPNAREVLDVNYSPDGSRLAAACGDGSIRMWETGSWSSDPVAFTGHTGPVQSARFSPDGSQLVSASSDRTVRVWDVIGAITLGVLEGHTAQVNDAGFSNDANRILSVSNDRTVRVWDAQRGEQVLSLGGHSAPVMALDFSPTARRVATASWDRSVVIWETTPYAERAGAIRLWQRNRAAAEVLGRGVAMDPTAIEQAIRAMRMDGSLDPEVRDMAARMLRIRSIESSSPGAPVK